MPPRIHPFPYDPFQQQAIDVIERDQTIFVAAPTGSGKTVLADYVIERSLARGQRVIYTAPVKALSNQKFRDFSVRHPDQVGILTGDVTINPTAPLMIMTTEIYRNTLLEESDRLAGYAWVIFDEVHFLDDQERGTVWEEAIMFTPPHINLLCLSATVPNVQELAAWIREVHGREVQVIESSHRPVPLTALFQCQNKVLDNEEQLKAVGYAARPAPTHGWRRYHHHRRGRDQGRPNRIDHLIRELLERDRLPAILFTFGRRRTEDLAWELSGLPLISPREQGELRAVYDDLCAKFQLTGNRTAEAMGRLIDKGVGFHHAGMLPTVKEVLERCFTTRLMKLIVTTETFALGVNMPARSVILDTLKKRSGAGFELLRRREFMQMAGRAGRRGMDKEGFVYLRVNPEHVRHQEVVELLHGKPEPVSSRFNTAYATLLNLYRRHGRALLDLYPKTLLYTQTRGERRQRGLDAMRHKLDLLQSLGYVDKDGLTRKGEFGCWMYGYELFLTELYAEGLLTSLDQMSLAVLAVAAVYEPRPTTPPPKPHTIGKRLAQLSREPLVRIHKEETRFKVSPKTKSPAFHLAHAMEAWMSLAPFDRLSKLCDVDEGEIVRYFRMAVQLLRQLAESPAGDAKLRAAAEKAFRRINRDVIDAEAQLRMG